MRAHAGQTLDKDMPRPSATAGQVYERLARVYGEPLPTHRLDAIAELVSTILSQNTNDRLRDKAFATLRTRFPTWEQVRDAPQEQVAAAIQVAGLYQQKAPAIQRALQRISQERGELSLDFLRALGVREAKAWLTSIKGVGPKTAAIVLLFSLDMPAFPVDTHIHRVTRRLGLIPDKTSLQRAHELLEAFFPSQVYYAAHLNLIRHGREVCQARRPRCEVCVLREVCCFYLDSTR